MIRILKLKSGTIITQHRVDDVYDDSTLPPGTQAADVADETRVEPGDLAGVEDVQRQVDVVDGALVVDRSAKTAHVERAERRRAADELLAQLDGDEGLEPAVRTYLVALRDRVLGGRPPSSAPSGAPPSRSRPT